MTRNRKGPKARNPYYRVTDQITAIAIIGDGSGKSFDKCVDGWSCENEEPPHKRGLVVNVDENIEVIIPFIQIRRFYLYMLENGLI